MLNGFTFDGINSLDYGFYISSASVYDAPNRVVEMTDVPGKNGALAIDTGRFENIEVKYHVYSACDTQEEFSENIQAFRNAVCSRYDYARLTDDYNAGEYRLALYKDGLTVNAPIDRYGGFDVVFECKPQRFLTSGETERSIPEWSDMHTDSGSLVTVDNSSGEYVVKSLSTAIEPQQDLNGYDNPWAGGAGKNICSVESIAVGGSNPRTRTIAIADIPAGDYYVSLVKGGTATYVGLQFLNSSSQNIANVDRISVQAGGCAITLNETAVSIYAYIGQTEYDAGKTFSVSNIQVEAGSVKTSYTPYSNICPITGVTGANIYVSPTTSVGDATTYNVSFGSAGTVYGGTLDVVSGLLTVTHKIISENDFHAVSSGTSGGGLHYANVNSSGYSAATSSNSLSNMLVNNQSGWGSTTPCYTTNTSGNPVRVYGVFTTLAEFKTAYAGLQIVYELATPLTYQLTATQVALLLGTNNIWSDTGDIQIEYGKGGNTLYNPTPFDSLPLIKVTGTGTLGIGSWIITITGTSGQIIYIDCDIMDAYKITGGIIESANNLVSFNKIDYPRLVSGLNNFSVGTGITEVKVTPRWWRV